MTLGYLGQTALERAENPELKKPKTLNTTKARGRNLKRSKVLELAASAATAEASFEHEAGDVRKS